VCVWFILYNVITINGAKDIKYEHLFVQAYIHTYNMYVHTYIHNSQYVYMRDDPKITRIFFLEGRGAVIPSAPAWCVYVTALRISWPSGVLEERSIGFV